MRYKGDENMSNTTNLVSLPVCECGYVFKNPILLKYDYMELDNFIFKIPIIEPNKCPNCNKKIESIMFGSDVVKTDNKNTKTNIYKKELSRMNKQCHMLTCRYNHKAECIDGREYKICIDVVKQVLGEDRYNSFLEWEKSEIKRKGGGQG
jgi:hypothetical protein